MECKVKVTKNALFNQRIHALKFIGWLIKK